MTQTTPEAPAEGIDWPQVAFALDALREVAGLSLEDLAYRAEIDPLVLWGMVNGAPMTAKLAARIAMELYLVLRAADAEMSVA